MRILILILVYFVSLTATAQEDPNEPGYDPAWEWAGDKESEWTNSRPSVQELRYSLTRDDGFQVEMKFSGPVAYPDEVCARGTWVGNYVEVKLPFVKGPDGPKKMIEPDTDQFSRITVERISDFGGALYKWYFAEPYRSPMLRVSFPWGEDADVVTIKTDLGFDPRRNQAPMDGWVCESGSMSVKRESDNTRFNTFDPYEITSVTAIGNELRIVTTLEELEIHHQQDGTSFWGGQFELRHSGSGGTVLKAIMKDDAGRMRPVMSESEVSLTKSIPKLTVVFTRGASLSGSLKQDYSTRDITLIRQVSLGSTSSMNEARVSVALPVGSYAYEFWTEGSTLVIRALTSEETQL